MRGALGGLLCGLGLMLAAGEVMAAATSVRNTERFYALTIGGKRVGYGHAQDVLSPQGDVKILSDTLIKLGILGTPLDLHYQAIAEYAGPGRTPRTFALTLTRGGSATTIRCLFHPGRVDWTQTIAGQTARRTIALPPQTRLVEGNLVETWDNVFRQAPRGATHFQATLFEPLEGKVETLAFAARPARLLSIAGKPVHCPVWATADEALSLAVDPRTGAVVRMDVPGQNAAFQIADKAALQNVGSFDGTSRAFALVDAPLGSGQGLTEVKLRVSAQVVGEKVTAASLQRAPTQRFAGFIKNGVLDGVFQIHSFQYAGAHAAPFPYQAATVGAQRPWLKPDALSESDDPGIRALARQLTAGAKTGWQATARIGRWVSDNIAYKITGASARVCLATRSGDCGPHTNLTIALCRAAGIPARMAGGALYTPLLGGSYGQHYWVRAWMGPADGWVPLDPTTGEIGTFRPTHLTLWNEGALGALSVKVMDWAPKAAAAAPGPQAIRRPNGLAEGYQEKYVFRAGGKEIGTQTATLTRVAGAVQTWSYALSLTIPQSGQSIPVAMSGTAAITETGTPQRLTLDATAAGMKQALTLDFGPKTAKAVIAMGDTKMPRDVAWSGDQFVALGNGMTFWSLAFRATLPSDGREFAVPFLFADALRPITMTLAPHGAEAITSGGKPVSCLIFDAAPLGQRLWLEKTTGALIKLTDDKQNLEVTRE